jgi:hypothetical protein
VLELPDAVITMSRNCVWKKTPTPKGVGK